MEQTRFTEATLPVLPFWELAALKSPAAFTQRCQEVPEGEYWRAEWASIPERLRDIALTAASRRGFAGEPAFTAITWRHGYPAVLNGWSAAQRVAAPPSTLEERIKIRRAARAAEGADEYVETAS